MTPQEKAVELVDKMTDEIPSNNSKDMMTFIEIDVQASKQCALIAVDEIIEIVYNSLTSIQELNYWLEVKQQIEQL